MLEAFKAGKISSEVLRPRTIRWGAVEHLERCYGKINPLKAGDAVILRGYGNRNRGFTFIITPPDPETSDLLRKKNREKNILLITGVEPVSTTQGVRTIIDNVIQTTDNHTVSESRGTVTGMGGQRDETIFALGSRHLVVTPDSAHIVMYDKEKGMMMKRGFGTDCLRYLPLDTDYLKLSPDVLNKLKSEASAELEEASSDGTKEVYMSATGAILGTLIANGLWHSLLGDIGGLFVGDRLLGGSAANFDRVRYKAAQAKAEMGRYIDPRHIEPWETAEAAQQLADKIGDTSIVHAYLYHALTGEILGN